MCPLRCALRAIRTLLAPSASDTPRRVLVPHTLHKLLWQCGVASKLWNGGWPSTLAPSDTAIAIEGAPVDLGPRLLGAVVSDGAYLYVHCSVGLLKVGTGFHGTEGGRAYAELRGFASSQVVFLYLVRLGAWERHTGAMP